MEVFAYRVSGLQVYAACVPPVASYGCELWGHRPLPGAVAKVRGSLSQVHVRHLRGICGLRANVPATIVLAEVQHGSLQQTWWSRLVHFWNSVAGLPVDSLHHQVALADCRDAVMHNIRNWAHAFMMGLLGLGYQFTLRCDRLVAVDAQRVKVLLAGREHAPLQELDICPRTCPSRGAQSCTYVRWFARPDRLPIAMPRSFAILRLPASLVKVVL